MKTLDIEKPDQLTIYLRERDLVGVSERLELVKLDGGVSNRTVLVRLVDSGREWVIKQALPKLRVQTDWFSDPARVHREALGLRWLGRLLPVGSVPDFVFEDFDHHLLIMDAVKQPHVNWKSRLLAGDVRMSHVEQFGGLLGTLHRVAGEHRSELPADFSDRRFFKELRLDPYYSYTAEQVPPARRFIADLIEVTGQHSDSLVHGDYSPKNVLVHAERLVLLDYEVMHLGDTAFDLGFSLTHFLSKAHHSGRWRVEFRKAAHGYWSSYSSALGSQVPWLVRLEERVVHHTLGCLLARVAGRSLLEYLDMQERAEQKRLVLGLIDSPPASVPELIDEFVGGLR